jgi:DNA-binding LacI/PurR family transcriptional regulator
MTRVLLIGYAPESVDFSDPALPPGLDAKKIAAGIELGLRLMRERGWQAEFCSVLPDDTAAGTVSRHLAAARYDCVVIGGGVRMSSTGLERFEAILNAVREAAPRTPIAFNTRPDDSADAAARWLEDA